MSFLIQPHVRLQEWVAEEHGYFREAGLDYEFEPQGLPGSKVSTSPVRTTDEAPIEVANGAFEDMQTGRAATSPPACHWAVNGLRLGRAPGRCGAMRTPYCPPGSSSRRSSDYQQARGPGGRGGGGRLPFRQPLFGHPGAGTVPGSPADRAELHRAALRPGLRLALERKVPAVNLFGPQYYALEQHGFRKLVDTTFMMGFLLSEDADAADVERYFTGLRRAQTGHRLRPERYKQYWLREMPDDTGHRGRAAVRPRRADRVRAVHT